MADVVMTFDAETAKAVQGFMRLEQREDMLKRKTDELRKKQDELAKAGGSVDAWTNGLAKVVTRFVSIGAVISVVRSSIDDLFKDMEKAKQFSMDTMKGMGSLAQLTSDKTQLRAMTNEARKSMWETGMSQQEAGGLQFALESSGKGGMRKVYSELYGVADPKAMLEAVNTLQGAMGKTEVGSDKQALDKIFAASSATKTDATSLAAAIAQSGEMSSMVGGSDEELSAMMAIMSRGKSSPSVASTQINALVAAANRQGIGKGQGVMQIVEEIQGKNLNRKQLTKLLDKEGLIAFQSLSSNAQEIKALQTDLMKTDAAAAAGGTTETMKRVEAYRSEFKPQFEAQRESRKSEMVKENEFAQEELSKDTIMSRFEQRSIQGGQNFLSRFIAKQNMKVGGWFMGEDRSRAIAEQSLLDSGISTAGFEDDETRKYIDRQRKAQATSINKTQDAVKITTTVEPAGPPADARGT